MTLAEAQHEVRTVFLNGAFGILAGALLAIGFGLGFGSAIRSLRAAGSRPRRSWRSPDGPRPHGVDRLQRRLRMRGRDNDEPARAVNRPNRPPVPAAAAAH